MSKVLKPGHCPYGITPTDVPVHPNYKRTPPVLCHLNKNSSITQFSRDKFGKIQLTWQRRSFVFHRVRKERKVPQRRLMRKVWGEIIVSIRRIPLGLIWHRISAGPGRSLQPSNNVLHCFHEKQKLNEHTGAVGQNSTWTQFLDIIGECNSIETDKETFNVCVYGVL